MFCNLVTCPLRQLLFKPWTYFNRIEDIYQNDTLKVARLWARVRTIRNLILRVQYDATDESGGTARSILRL